MMTISLAAPLRRFSGQVWALAGIAIVAAHHMIYVMQ